MVQHGVRVGRDEVIGDLRCLKTRRSGMEMGVGIRSQGKHVYVEMHSVAEDVVCVL